MKLGNAFAALLCGALVVLPGCGDSNKGKPIPSDQANHMIALIQRADQQSSDGTCNGARAKVREAQGIAAQLPTSVDKDVRQGVTDGLAHMDSLIQSECQRPQRTQTQTTPTDTTPTETTQSQTTPTETTQTQTTPTQTTPTQTTLTETTPTLKNSGTTTTPGNGGTPPGQANGAAGDQG